MGSNILENWEVYRQESIRKNIHKRKCVCGSDLAENAWDFGNYIDRDCCEVVDKEDHWKKGNI